MNEDPEFYSSLGIELPEIVSHKERIKSPGNLRDFLKDAPKTTLSSLVYKGPSSRGQVVQPCDSGKPGFSNKPLVQLEQYTPDEIQAHMAWKSIIAAVVTREKAQSDKYIQHIFHADVPRNIVAACEDQIINGSGSKFTGLLQASDEERLELGEERIDFFYRVLEEYASRTGRMPTHIMLPYTEILKLLISKQQRITYAAQGFRHKSFDVFGVPVIESAAIPENRGLILAVDELVLASPPGLEWEFGYSNSELEARDLLAIVLRCKMALLLKRPETIRQLSLHTPFERNHTSDASKTFHKSQPSGEAQA